METMTRTQTADISQPVQALIDAAVADAIQAAGAALDERLDAVVAQVARTAARAAIGALERDEGRRQKEGYDRKYHNTKLLIRNYRRLAAFFENAVVDLDGAEEIDASFDTVMRMMRNADGHDDYIVESLQTNVQKTRIIMAHVEKMLSVYADMCERSPRPEDARRWRCLYYMYLSDDTEQMTAEEVAERENIDRRTVYKDLDVCYADLTSLLFGITGLEKQHIR